MNKYEGLIDDFIESNVYDENVEKIKKLVERDTPKKVIKMETMQKEFYLTYCECDYELNSTLKMNYCPNCGQALDWSDE